MLAMEPDYMIFDEPVTMLDHQEQLEIIALLRQLFQRKSCCILLITHNLQEAIMAERLIILHQGQIALDGKATEVAVLYEQLVHLGIEPLEMTSLLHQLQAQGFADLNQVLEPEAVVEELCRLKSRK
jgi:energy-coupling factor transport system ATP-binding protein